MKVKSEDVLGYGEKKDENRENRIIDEALNILSQRFFNENAQIHNPELAQQYIMLRLSQEDALREHLGCIFLNAKNRPMECKIMSHGTVDQSACYPREILRYGMRIGAVSLILFHNHPSGDVEPSQEDEKLTQLIKEACALLGFRLHDHIVVAGANYYSFNEMGKL